MIQIKSLIHSFENKRILDIPQLSVKKGTLHILFGSNGAGKTTLMRMINKLERPDQGTLDVEATQRNMVLCFQTPYMFHGTVRQNIEYGLKIRGLTRNGEVKNIIKQLGLNHMTNQHAHSLSAGEKHRTALARAMVLNPRLLLLDEPFAHLDPQNTILAEKAVKNLHERGSTIIIATHIPERMKLLSGTTIHMEEGCIIGMS